MRKSKELLYILVAIVFLAILNLILAYFESQTADSGIQTFWDAIWYMVVTLTTVGYGDLYPSSTAGKIIGYAYVFSSLGVLGYLFSTISNKIYQIMEEKKLGFKGVDFTNHIIIIGWNEFSRMVTDEIYHTRKKMAIVTDKKDDIDLIYERYNRDTVFVLFSDYHNLEALSKVNAEQSAVTFINLNDDSEALMYILDFKKEYPGSDIVVSLQKPRLKDTFKSAGVTYVVARSEIASKLVASYIFEPDVAEINIDLLSSARDDNDHDVQEFLVNGENPFKDINFLDAFFDTKKKYDSILVGIRKSGENGGHLLTNPGKDVTIEDGDYLIILATGLMKKKSQEEFGVQEGKLI